MLYTNIYNQVVFAKKTFAHDYTYNIQQRALILLGFMLQCCKIVYHILKLMQTSYYNFASNF